MSLSEVPSPPAGPRTPGRRLLSSGSTVLAPQLSSAFLTVPGRSSLELDQQLSATHDQSDYIPDEILQVLTSVAGAPEKAYLGPDRKSKAVKDGKAGLRATDQVWHHPIRRSKFKHLTDQPICITGAGRDISFLCDALAIEKRNMAISSLQPNSQSELTPRKMEGNLEDSIIPKEFYIVKNKGVLGLEYYEDKYTTLIEDDEKKLRLFPSLKPSGRAEVLQLMKVMDSMLKDAGVDDKDKKLEGPTQIHNLLELLKTEQNIYNIVFHELIRQVSVECTERGELLAKLRQRYVMLLDKIPRQLLSLYNDLLAQRALHQCLTEEIIYFKNSIEELTNELYQVREHDLRVSKDAEQAQAELAKALNNAKKNANLLEEYRELYELQRSRLETQVLHLTEERDLWSSATYRLARKVIEANHLHLARKMYLSEKAWTKIVRHFLVLLASKDTKDLSEIQQTAEKWREHMARFEREVKRSEESSREKLRIICRDLEKWHLYFQEKVFVDWHYYPLPEDLASSVLEDLKSWEHMLTEEQQQFEGSKVLGSQEALKTAADIQMEWSQLGEEVLKRHQDLDGKPPPEHKAMEDLNTTIEELYEQYRRRIEGENGVAKGLMAFLNSLENWHPPVSGAKYAPRDIKEADWSNLFHLLPEWVAQGERLLELIGSPSSEENPSPVEKLEPEDVFKKLQHWVLAITSGTERDDVRLTQHVTSLHTAMVQYMVDILILLSPDVSSDPSDTHTSEPDQEELAATLPVKNVQEQAVDLGSKLKAFSCYVIGCCQEIVESLPMDEVSGYESRQLQTIKSSCDEWIETCQLLLSNVLERVPLEAPQHPAESKEVPDHPEDVDHVTVVLPEGIHIENPEVRLAKESSRQIGTDSEADLMKIIGYDGNIHKKSLREIQAPVSLEGDLHASRPTTPRSMQAFQNLTSLEQLEKRLLDAETRAQKAEERSESLDEQLKVALQRIKELEIKSEDEKTTDTEESPVIIEVPNEEVSHPVPTKKRPKSSRAKQHR